MAGPDPAEDPVKLIVTLLAAQTVLLAFLAVKLLAIEDRLAVESIAARANPGLPAGAPGPDLEQAAHPDHLTEEWLRRIIRDELAMQIERSGLRADVPGPQERAGSSPVPESGTTDANFDPYAADAIDRRIDYFISVGAINEADMRQLQSDIAKLSPSDRRRMLTKLVSALNSGTLDGRM